MKPNIKEVAIYLRKSRDESDGKEDVLAKHESLLLEYAKNHNLKYRIYKEIGSSEYIDSRPKMVRLLSDVSQKLYDAVLVVDLDRLSRGDLEEMGRISRVFRDSKTIVITPTKTYDFNNEDQALINNFEMVFANHEFRMIRKRMIRGKQQGTKAGKWTNGRPPFPYVYNRLTKELDVDPDKVKVYELMKKMFLEDMKATYEIAWRLNELGFKTNRNSYWYENTVRRILKNEVHLGKVVYGKTSGSGSKKKLNANGVQIKDRSEWIIAEGSHQPLKTEEEHQRILAILESRRYTPKGTRTNVQVLSKLIYCGKCNRVMSFTGKASGKRYVKTCLTTDRFGYRCHNRSLNVEVIYAQLFLDLERYEQQLLGHEPKEKQDDSSTLQLALQNKDEELERLEKGIERIKDLFIDEIIDKLEMQKRIEKHKKLMQTKKEEIRSIEQSLAVIESVRTDNDRINAIREFKKAWNTEGITKRELNTLAKQLIERIEYVREGNNINMKIQFL
ncbi:MULTISPECIES: recombinase family protein [Bacillus cereus group]|uniref:recombinase family protein n=1 Tax=Bacillus cereus group TaxID=86661 RepID=UPI000A303884|nr:MULTISPECIES: recombinase family protein [Bacillus cereus group]MCU5591555.1 recombinase family protein [Bacillus mobilis]MCU5738439.1 recombinase family protein [Bacillus mobilis]MCU9562287.1 recombinase family protein [Bacillus mobilis]MCX9098933.1 recombinase family protein [Bacillus anthracis]PEC07481.1 recombinase family protein [Bacillus toyonensis]